MAHAYLPLHIVEAAAQAAADRRVSTTALGPGGFFRAYARAAGDPRRLGAHRATGQPWPERREHFIRRHRAGMEDDTHADGWEPAAERDVEEGSPEERPTRRHLALAVWAWSPSPKRLERWLLAEGWL